MGPVTGLQGRDVSYVGRICRRGIGAQLASDSLGG